MKQETDMACNAFAGLIIDSNILELTVLVLSESFGILAPYPVPKTSKYGPALIFSGYVILNLLT